MGQVKEYPLIFWVDRNNWIKQYGTLVRKDKSRRK